MWWTQKHQPSNHPQFYRKKKMGFQPSNLLKVDGVFWVYQMLIADRKATCRNMLECQKVQHTEDESNNDIDYMVRMIYRYTWFTSWGFIRFFSITISWKQLDSWLHQCNWGSWSLPTHRQSDHALWTHVPGRICHPKSSRSCNHDLVLKDVKSRGFWDTPILGNLHQWRI